MADIKTIRETYQHNLEEKQSFQAMQAARDLLGINQGAAQWRFLHQSLNHISEDATGLKPLRIGLLASFSIEFIHDALVSFGIINGFRIIIHQAGFAQYHQEIHHPDSGLFRFNPDVVILAIEGKDLDSGLYEDFSSQRAQRGHGFIQKAIAEMASLLKTFRQHANAALLVHNFAPPPFPELGILDGQQQQGQIFTIAALNRALVEIAVAHPDVHVVNYAALVSRIGSNHWYDLRMADYARFPIAQSAIPTLVQEYLKFFRALTGMTKKCLVLDLDNTLWGGILGEDGIKGIQLGPQYPGSAYVTFQRTVLALHKRGIILALASKNNREDVLDVLVNHPHMVLKREHFSHMEVHWQPKSTSLVNSAQVLNIGLEHMVFVDDSPVECAQIREALPQVRVIQFPQKVEAARAAILDEGLFDSLSYSAEDSQRHQLYQQRTQAETLRAETASLEDFYRNLEMTVYFSTVHEGTLTRTTQLTQKTNQFNLTTRRYSTAEVLEKMHNPHWLLVTVRVTDRFGDNGIVGVMMAEKRETYLDVDTFLLSCRVIGRTIESAMLAYLCEQTTALGLERIQGMVIPTDKNHPAQDIYQRHGFTLLSAEAQGKRVWTLNLHEGSVDYPQWLSVKQE